ncbi:MAG: HAMP domain-containing histidine kinase [Oscillospiraceae bacterium]|nr:HAMP domain-containing histidine kinase [Oscillospiraceae bacterium]
MKKRIISIAALFSAIIMIAAMIFALPKNQTYFDDIKAEQLVALNEIEQLAKSGEYDKAAEKTAALSEAVRAYRPPEETGNNSLILCGICVVCIIYVLGYVYYAVLRPFEKLKGYAAEIAKGNFDIPLDYERSNYFGEFTWAFDNMRKEIISARACEREAVENNKTVIASLSHDIKTPVASILAYAEALEANMDGTPEKREKYLSVIIKKCGEVSKLTNDLFLHSLSDMDKLKIVPEKMELCGFIENAVCEIAAERNDVRFEKPSFTATVKADKNRLMQITENLINNARKYAGTDIDVFITRSEKTAEIHFRDYGKGIPDSDMPFIFDKFYRGKNCGSEQGSGLGLYIVKYIAMQLNGDVTLRNLPDGLEVTVTLAVCE